MYRDFYSVDISWSQSSNIDMVEDDVYPNWDVAYTNDGLERLTRARRGDWDGSSFTDDDHDEQWTLGQTGNWEVYKLDLNGDTDFTVSREGPLKYTPRRPQAAASTAVVSREGPLKYTFLPSDQPQLQAVVSREGPLKYTPGHGLPLEESAVVSREGPLKYTLAGQRRRAADAVVSREGPLKYTARAGERRRRLAVVSREGPLKYTSFPAASTA